MRCACAAQMRQLVAITLGILTREDVLRFARVNG